MATLVSRAAGQPARGRLKFLIHQQRAGQLGQLYAMLQRSPLVEVHFQA